VKRLTDGERISGCTRWAGRVYCIFMRGPIVVLDQAYGIKKNTIQLSLPKLNAGTRSAARDICETSTLS
jgi:hypothetical protein